MQQVVALTPSQLTEVCVQFASEMGWIGRPGGTDWYMRLKTHGDPETFHASLDAAMRAAVQTASGENNTDLDALEEFKESWEAVNG